MTNSFCSSGGGAFVQVEWRLCEWSGFEFDSSSLFQWSGVCASGVASSGVASSSGGAFVPVEWCDSSRGGAFVPVEWCDSSATNAGLTMNAPMQVFMLPGVSLSS